MSRMRCSAAVVLLVALLAVPLSTYFLVDVPEGMDNPRWARALLTVIKISGVIGDTVEPLFGPDYHVAAIRLMIETAHAYLPHPSPPEGVHVQNATFGGVPVLVYVPTDLIPDGPGIVYFHGGGWVFGTVVHDRIPMRLAAQLKAVVVAVEYRLAPEHVFPAPLEDCEAATVHFMDNALEYGVDPDKVIVAGDSAGGNLAAAVSLSLRNKEFYPPPAAQILIYPALQPLDFRTPSYHLNPRHAIIRTHLMASSWLWYAVGHANYKHVLLANQHTPAHLQAHTRETTMRLDKLPRGFVPENYQTSILTVDSGKHRDKWAEIGEIFTNPLFAPMMADDVSELPPSLMVTVEHDILRDEGAWYAHRLAEAGVTTVHKHYMHSFHGILSFDTLKESHEVLNDVVSFIRQHV